MSKARIAALAVIVLIVATAGAQAASLIKDGGFEAPTVPVGGFTSFAKGATIARWTVVGSGGGVAIVSGTYTQGSYSFPAAAGKQWLDLTGYNSNGAEGVEQTVKTVAGTNYKLSFKVGNLSGGIWGTQSTVNVFVNGIQVFTATNATPGTTQNWRKFTYTFQATGATTTIDFINGDPSNDNSNGLDAVTLVALP